MDSDYNQIEDVDNGRVVRLDAQNDQRDGSSVAVPIMTFSDAVAWFCLSQEAFRSELARVGEGESARTNLGGHNNGQN